jgi:hypothetical protein
MTPAISGVHPTGHGLLKNAMEKRLHLMLDREMPGR